MTLKLMCWVYRVAVSLRVRYCKQCRPICKRHYYSVQFARQVDV